MCGFNYYHYTVMLRLSDICCFFFVGLMHCPFVFAAQTIAGLWDVRHGEGDTGPGKNGRAEGSLPDFKATETHPSSLPGLETHGGVTGSVTYPVDDVHLTRND